MRARTMAGSSTLLHVAVLAMTALACTGGTSVAQDASDIASDPDNPILNRNARRSFGLDASRNGLSALRTTIGGGSSQPSGPLTASPSSNGETSGGDASSGLSGGGEGLSRLPRFRTGGQAISSLSGRNAQTPSLLRQRAAPPRRYAVPTRTIVRERTQGYPTDLRLTPVIQNPVSGVPSPSSVPLARSIPLLGLINPTTTLLSTAFTRRPDDADPAYAPLGIKLGTITVLPAFTQYVGYDSNPDQTIRRAAKSSAVLRSEGELAFRSDWSSSQLAGELRGGYSDYPQNDPASRPNAAGTTRLRLDVNRDTRIELEGRFVVDTQRTGSPDVGAPTSTSRPLFATYGATAGVSETFNRLQLTLRGTFDRQVFDDAQLSNGTTLIQSDRNANQYGVRLRAGYEISPVLTPFVEVLADTRVYDTPVDQSGLRRDSDGIGFVAGATLELSRTVSGEISAGLQRRSYVDPTLRNISAPLVNAALIWAASPLTTVRFNQQTGVIETSVPGSSGVFTDVASVEVQHDLLRNLSITVGGNYIRSDYQGVRIRENGFSALARIDYRFNRWLTLRGSYIYQQLDSTSPNSSFRDNTFLVGLRVNP